MSSKHGKTNTLITTVNLVRLTVDISYYQVHPQEHISITMDFKKIHILNYL